METKVKIEGASTTREDEYHREESRRPIADNTALLAVATTSASNLGWPSELTIYNLNGESYFRVQDILREFDLKTHVDKQGYKFIDKLLQQQGESEPFLFNNEKRKERLFIRHSAAVTILLMFKGKAGSNAECINVLRRHILQNVVPLSINATTQEPSAIITAHQENRPFATPAVTGPLASATQEPSKTATNQQDPWQSVTPSSVLTPKTHKGTPFSTTQLIKARNLRNEFKRGRSNTRARALDARIKQHKSAFKKIAEEIHHGAKEDLIAGIVETASKKSTNADNWDGSLSFDDILVIAKRSRHPKTKKSLYDILTSEQSAKENH